MVTNIRVAIATGLFLVSVLSTGCSSIAYKMGVADCAPVYGNWCGENYPLTGYDPRPVDTWDRACMRHDKCYDDGTSKEVCDREFIAELEELSYKRLAPQRIHNAHSVFRKDGFVGGWVGFGHEFWAAGATCEGGDGVRAQFFCALNYYNSCPLSQTFGPGRAGMRCNCRGYPGTIVEI